MKKLLRQRVLGVFVAGAMFAASATAQTVGQDIKDAGHDTAHATKTTAHKVKHGTEKGAHKVAHGTKKAAHKVEQKTDPDNPK